MSIGDYMGACLNQKQEEPVTKQPTPRQLQVMRLIALGLCNKEIAYEMGITMSTVERMREHLYKRLDLHNTADITRRAMTMGLVHDRTSGREQLKNAA